MAKRQKPTDALNELLAVASPEVLTDLIRQLTIGRPDVRRECFEFLKSQVQVSKALKGKSEGEIVLTLCSELLPDLDELDSYGGGSYTGEDHVFGLLDQISGRDPQLLSFRAGEFDRKRHPQGVCPQGQGHGQGAAYAGRSAGRRSPLDSLCGKGQKGQCKAAGASGGVCRFGAGVVGVEMIWTQTEKKDSLS